jgi:MFS family permease
MNKSLPTIPKSLWHNYSFLLLWGGRSISFLGTTLTSVLFPILVYQQTHSPLLTSLLQACATAPYVLFGLFAGALADRADRKVLMAVSDSINAILLASIPMALLLHVLSLLQMFLVLFLSETFYVWYDAANFGAVPALAGNDQIVSANSMQDASVNLSNLLGPPLAGILLATFGPLLALSCDALSYVISVLSLLLIPRPFQTSRPKISIDRSFLRWMRMDIAEGLQFVWHQSSVRALTLLSVGNTFTTGAVTGLLVVYGTRVLGFGQNDGRLALLFTALGIGALLASLFLPALVKRISPGCITLLSLSLTPWPLLGLTLTSNVLLGEIFLGLWSACNGLTVLNGISLRQMLTPDHLRSRVNTTARVVGIAGMPLGAMVGGLIAQGTTIQMTYLIMAGGVALSALLGWFTPLRHPLPDDGTLDSSSSRGEEAARKVR